MDLYVSNCIRFLMEECKACHGMIANPPRWPTNSDPEKSEVSKLETIKHHQVQTVSFMVS